MTKHIPITVYERILPGQIIPIANNQTEPEFYIQGVGAHTYAVYVINNGGEA